MNFSRNLKRLMLVSLGLLFLMGANFQQPQTVYPEQSAQSQRKVSAKSINIQALGCSYGFCITGMDI